MGTDARELQSSAIPAERNGSVSLTRSTTESMEYERFFAELVPRLEMARDLERKLGRKLAHRSNNLDYLRDDELGLSRIIADLLNPKASHGQGVLFLQTLLVLERLKNIRLRKLRVLLHVTFSRLM